MSKETRIKFMKRICFPLLILLVLWAVIHAQAQDDYFMYDFTQPGSVEGWQIIAVPDDLPAPAGYPLPSSGKSAVFSGEMKKNVNRSCLMISPPGAHQLRSYGGISIRLKGDGKYYRMCLYNHSTIPGVSFQAGFKTRKDRLDIVFLPFSSFAPYYRGRFVRDWPVLDQSQIIRIGFLSDNRQPGPFRLEIHWIKAIGY